MSVELRPRALKITGSVTPEDIQNIWNDIESIAPPSDNSPGKGTIVKFNNRWSAEAAMQKGAGDGITVQWVERSSSTQNEEESKTLDKGKEVGVEIQKQDVKVPVEQA